MDKPISYDKLIQNVNTMINTLEWDAMRSPGKTKQNAEVLVALYSLKGRYGKRPNTQKEG